jgi:syntaxin 5
MNPTRPAQASFRDRTNEFRAAVESARRHAAPSSSSAPTAASSSSTGSLDGMISATSARSEFNNRASKIGLGIHQTSQKLARLAKCMASVLLLPVLPDSYLAHCFILAVS